MFISARLPLFEIILTTITSLFSFPNNLISSDRESPILNTQTLNPRNHTTAIEDEDQDSIKAAQARRSCSRNPHLLLPVTYFIPRLSFPFHYSFVSL